MQPIHRMKLHKVMIQSLSFSKDERYLASLGGQDDNQLVTWDVSAFLSRDSPPLIGLQVAVSEINYFSCA